MKKILVIDAEHPTLKTLLKLADAFGIRLNGLVGRK
jgi:hypothetical protein